MELTFTGNNRITRILYTFPRGFGYIYIISFGGYCFAEKVNVVDGGKGADILLLFLKI